MTKNNLLKSNLPKQSLKVIAEVYKKGGNIVQYLKKTAKSEVEKRDRIMISYDLQSGSYIAELKRHPDFYKKYVQAIAKVINSLGVDYRSLLEAGVGEATTLANLIPELGNQSAKIYGFDLAWSRVKYAQAYTAHKSRRPAFLFMGDLFKIPLADSSMDIVYTSHAIESNQGREKEALLELMRVTNKYLVLLEPDYELAGPAARKRMREFGYIRNLYSSAKALGLEVIEHRLFDLCSNPLNPTGLIIIKKKPGRRDLANPLICPITKTPLEFTRGSFFSKAGLLAYPQVDGVPCLLEDQALIATHYLDNFKNV